MNNNPMMNQMQMGQPPQGMGMNNMGPPPSMPMNNGNNNNNPMMNSQNNGMMNGPPLSGPNPFMMPPPNMMNPMMMPPPNPQITVGQLPPNMSGLPPSPPPPNNMPMPPDPSNFRLKNISIPQKSMYSNEGTEDNKNTDSNDKNNGNNVNQQSANKAPNQFQLPFNNLPPSFPVPQAPPQLNGGTGPNTPNRTSTAPNMMPSFLPPLGDLNNPMFKGLHHAMGGSTSNSPSLNPLNPSPPNSLFIPPYPPSNMGNTGLPFGTIPSPNITQLHGFNPMRPTTSPSPPVSPLLRNLPVPPFIPSPQMNMNNNANMPPINLNNPMFNKAPPMP